ncbi:MAG: hypothetical protein BroJett013_36420 [Alphaproteobacteria bacterium]|nr:MAG: hypothetical protein BroJett013_36420 [Alphaproteobacteria bacterium]
MSFDKAMEAHMVRWRSAHCQIAEHGRQNGRAYPWILPHGAWREGLWAELRPGGLHPLEDYLEREGIQKHAGVHNLKSSWVLCANLYWPFGQTKEGRALLAGFLQMHVDKSIAAVEAVELEWAGAGALSPERLLGETGGARGSGQTSPDIAFFVRTVNGRQGLVLTENKFVEHSFYRCSARRTRGSADRPANPDRARCTRAAELLSDHEALCHQHSWGRRYWDHLAGAGDRNALAQLKTCPGASGGYQLLRQHALAEALAEAS